MKLTYKDFEYLWGISLTPAAIIEIEQMDYEYEVIDSSEESALVIEILDEISQDKFVKSGQSRAASWEKG